MRIENDYFMQRLHDDLDATIHVGNVSLIQQEPFSSYYTRFSVHEWVINTTYGGLIKLKSPKIVVSGCVIIFINTSSGTSFSN